MARLSHSHSSTSFFSSPPKINSIGTPQHNTDTTTTTTTAGNNNSDTIGVKVKTARKGHNSDSQHERLIDPGLDLTSLLTNSIYNTNTTTTHVLDSTNRVAPVTLTSPVTTSTTTKPTTLPNITSTSSSFVQGSSSEPFNDSVIIMTDRTDSRCSTSQLSLQNSINNNRHITNTTNTNTTTTHSISINNHNNNVLTSPLFNSPTPNPESISGMRGSSYSTTKLKYNTLLRK